MPEYQHLTDDEVLQVASEREQLTDEGRVALDVELSRRKLTSGDLGAHIAETEAWEEEDRRRRAARGLSTGSSFSRKFFGKANRRRDPGSLFELYESTLWFVVLWFPVFPIATYTVGRNFEIWMGMRVTSDEIVLDRHPRNWEQILLTWVKASAALLALRLAFMFAGWWIRHRG